MKLEHLGIAVKSVEERIKIWKDIFGFKVETIQELPEHKVKIAAFDANGIKIELIEPLDKDSPVTKFLEKRGEGLHHICFEVKNIESTIQELKNKGIEFVDKSPRRGAFAKKVIFLHPKTTSGVLIELCEK